MSVLSDYLQPPTGTPLGFSLSDIAMQRSRAGQDTGLTKTRNTMNYRRGQSDLVDRFSDRGLGYGGKSKNQAAGRMQEDYTWGQDDAERLLRRTRQDLQRRRLLATIGVGA